MKTQNYNFNLIEKSDRILNTLDDLNENFNNIDNLIFEDEEKTSEIEKRLIKAENKIDQAEAILDTQVATGENVYFDNAKNYPLMSLKGEGKSEQVTTTGKSILPNTATTLTTNGITFKINDDKSITISGTSTAKASINLYTTERTLEVGSYTISTGLSQKIGVSLGIQIDDAYYPTDTSKLIELSANATFKKWYIDVESGKTVNTTIYPMFEEGTEATPYEPYTGGQPSPNPDYPQEIKTILGYSLFNKLKAKFLNGYLDNGVFLNGETAKTLCFNCEENTTYIISKILSARFRVAISDSIPNNGDALNVKSYDTSNSITVTTNAGDKYLIIYYYSSIYDTKKEQEILDSIEIINNSIIYKGIGINLINPADLINNADINLETGVEISSEGKRTISTVFYEIDPNSNYCFLRPHNTLNVGLRCYNSNYEYLGMQNLQTGLSYLFKANFEDTKYIKFIDEGNTLDDGYLLAKSDVVLPFKPYQESTVSIDLQGNELASVGTVSDKLLIDRKGNVAIEKNVGKVVLDGSEDEGWIKNTNFVSLFYNDLKSLTGLDNMNIGINIQKFVSDTYIFGGHVNASTEINKIGIYGFINGSTKTLFKRLNIKHSEEIDLNLEDFKAWLQENNVTVYFQLATPELISLGTISNPEIFKGVNNIVVETNIGNMNVEVEYVEDLQLRIEKIEQAIVAQGGI